MYLETVMYTSCVYALVAVVVVGGFNREYLGTWALITNCEAI